MRFWPQSLFGRNVFLMVGLILSSQAVAVLVLGVIAFLPQTQRVAGIVSDAMGAMSATMDALPPRERAELLTRLNESPYIDFLPAHTPPPMVEGSPTVLERVFMQELVDRLDGQSELVWRTGAGRVLWVKIRIGPESYWIAVRPRKTWDPFSAAMLVVLVVSGLSMLAGFVLSRQIAQPLRDLQTAADGLSLGSARTALEARGPTEIRLLAGSFNRMTQRLAVAEEDRAMVLAGISHDLRTPLAKLRLAVEMMPIDSDLHATATAQVARMDRLLQQFLDYARGFDIEPLQVVDLASLARECAAACDPSGGVEVRTIGWVEGWVRPEAIRRALSNLIDNALAHGRPPVEVLVTEEENGVAISVRDCGAGLPEESLVAIKTPFRRGENVGRVVGSGLGLAIAERIALLHGGQLVLRNREEGGLEARLTLPAARLDATSAAR